MFKTNRGQRLPEQIFRVVMWAIAVLFAIFLIGLGSLIIGDLPKAGEMAPMEQFESAELKSLRAQVVQAERDRDALNDKRDQAQLQNSQAVKRWSEAKQSFDNWIATRTATTDPAQDPEVLRRTRELDALQAKATETEKALEAIDQQQLNIMQSVNDRRISELEQEAQTKYDSASNQHALKVFLWRLMFTLPLLLLAAWLFVKKRRSRYWPFVWGFIFFAAFAFFFELVPYLPSYGGYVRYIVGIALLGVAGWYGIRQMQAYLARKQAEEAAMLQSTQEQRRQQFTYEQALGHLAKGVCPSCERQLSSSDPGQPADFCVHCGLCVYKNCPQCSTRCSTFFKFCSTCGYQMQASEDVVAGDVLAVGPVDVAPVKE